MARWLGEAAVEAEAGAAHDVQVVGVLGLKSVAAEVGEDAEPVRTVLFAHSYRELPHPG